MNRYARFRGITPAAAQAIVKLMCLSCGKCHQERNEAGLCPKCAAAKSKAAKEVITAISR